MMEHHFLESCSFFWKSRHFFQLPKKFRFFGNLQEDFLQNLEFHGSDFGGRRSPQLTIPKEVTMPICWAFFVETCDFWRRKKEDVDMDSYL